MPACGFWVPARVAARLTALALCTHVGASECRIVDEQDPFEDARGRLSVLLGSSCNRGVEPGCVVVSCAHPQDEAKYHPIRSITFHPINRSPSMSSSGVDALRLRFDREASRRYLGAVAGESVVLWPKRGALSSFEYDLRGLLDSMIVRESMLFARILAGLDGVADRNGAAARLDLAASRGCLRDFRRRCDAWHDNAGGESR